MDDVMNQRAVNKRNRYLRLGRLIPAPLLGYLVDEESVSAYGRR